MQRLSKFGLSAAQLPRGTVGQVPLSDVDESTDLVRQLETERERPRPLGPSTMVAWRARSTSSADLLKKAMTSLSWAAAFRATALNQHESINSGFAADLWRPNPFMTKSDAFSGVSLERLFSGIQVDVAVRDSDAWIHRVSYQITLLGKIVFMPIVIT